MSVRCPSALCALLTLAFLAGPTPARGAAETEQGGGAEPPGARSVVEVRTEDYAFYAPSELPSGWTTFRMRNDGAEPHFLVLWRLPEGRTFDEYAEEVVGSFAALVPQYRAGEIDREELLAELGTRLPAWFHPAAQGRGGPGFLSPGRTVETTVELEPGTYVMECYMTNPEGELHSERGMLRPLIVTDEPSGGSPPAADVELTLSNYEIVTEGELSPGRNTVRVRVAEQPEGLLGHDVHLVRLDAETSVEEVVRWMDWADALQSPAPAEFVGGAEQVPAGHTTYFTVDLEPGRYAWISEGYAREGMVREVAVAE